MSMISSDADVTNVFIGQIWLICQLYFKTPIIYPDNNFSIEVNQTVSSGAQSSWYYNFADGKLYPDINHSTNFKTFIAAESNTTYNINTSIRMYYISKL
jgi:hypothetical protein